MWNLTSAITLSSCNLSQYPGMKFCDLDQGLCSRAGLPTPLLPLLERSNGDSKQRGELGLRKPGLFASTNDSKRFNRIPPTNAASFDITNALKYLATDIAGLFPPG